MEVVHPTYPKWRLTGFYGYPENERRRDSWDLLRTLAQDNSLPWCVMGDFNDLLSNEEKEVEWTTHHGGLEDAKEERLDRAMVTQTWFDIFPNCQLHNVIADRSDHYPILLKLHESHRRRFMKDFKFENSWLHEEELEGVVQEGWEKGDHGDLLVKIQHCTDDMNEWGRQLRNTYRIEIEECRRELEMLRDSDQHMQGTRYEEVRRRMSVLLAQEEAFWKQRAKIYWLREGDTGIY
ncbi:endonuclease/exonuclease/phosphatase family protein [Trifolium medium]|uniref:Endonuclease/exonuclease/phosphatase family protein n=1 Tax=Trifolium medium TaxID=97028 RepID=A0A392MWT8_9FABA|nr:endonuclease/exonuclease/phosphatase family protein [Trifolium medium]